MFEKWYISKIKTILLAIRYSHHMINCKLFQAQLICGIIARNISSIDNFLIVAVPATRTLPCDV